MDVVSITQDLIKIPSITPSGKDCLLYVEQLLRPLGFTCHRLTFDDSDGEPVDNLYAEFGTTGPNLCFAGHVDVVPPGLVDDWTYPPFAGEITNGVLYGRGAVDMKGAIGAYLAALQCVVPGCQKSNCRLSILLTADEEGPAINGTAKMVDWLRQENKQIDLCILGEPTSVTKIGDTIKIGRRGSVTGFLTVFGTQGHVAYPDEADNPISRIMTTLQALSTQFPQHPYPDFDLSTFQITTIDVANPVTNVIPGRATATFNIRFNPAHTLLDLKQWAQNICSINAGRHDLTFTAGSAAFMQQPSVMHKLVQNAVYDVMGYHPRVSTRGGTSDARFIHTLCPVIELGLLSTSMHKIDEHVSVTDLNNLSQIYRHIIQGWPNPA